MTKQSEREEKIQEIRRRSDYQNGSYKQVLDDNRFMLEEIERLQIALFTHQNCDKSAAELYVEVERWKRQYEALIQSIKDGLGEWPPAKSAEDLVGWIESTCPFVGDLREEQSVSTKYRIFKVNDDYIAAETME